MGNKKSADKKVVHCFLKTERYISVIRTAASYSGGAGFCS